MNLTLEKVYSARPYTMNYLEQWLMDYCEPLKPFIKNASAWLREADRGGKKILFEAQLGALRDLDYGIHPYTTSSNPIAAYAPVGSGYPKAKLERVIGVVKAYSTCVGEGPFVSEMFGEEADKLREAGQEYGAKTGRPRRVGALDLVATRYGVEMQGATEIALTKLDVLSYLDEIPVCTQYLVNGEPTDEFPFPTALKNAEPVVKTVPGWRQDISGVRRFEDLPKAAQDYVLMIEEGAGYFVKYVSVGPERESIITRRGL